MSTKEDGGSRGGRVRLVREAGGWDQHAFAALLNEAAQRRRYAMAYDAPKVSRMENGKRDVSLDDAVLVADLDPEHRTVEWIAGAAELKPLRNGQKRRRAGNG